MGPVMEPTASLNHMELTRIFMYDDEGRSGITLRKAMCFSVFWQCKKQATSVAWRLDERWTQVDRLGLNSFRGGVPSLLDNNDMTFDFEWVGCAAEFVQSLEQVDVAKQSSQSVSQ